MDAFIGTILPWAVDYAPDGWFICDGSLLQISNYQALFALIGNRYGGNGTTNFALPDLRGRFPIGAAQGVPGRSYFPIGSTGGGEQTTLTVQNLPSHNHTCAVTATGGSPNPSVNISAEFKIPATSTTANAVAPASNTYLAATPPTRPSIIYNNTVTSPDIAMPGGTIAVSGPVSGLPTGYTANVGLTGSNVPFTNLPSFQSINYIICYSGIFPPRP